MPDPYSGQGADTQWLSDLSAGIGLGAGIGSGTGRGQVQAGTSAAKLFSNLKAFGSASGTVGSFAGDVANLTNIITGIQQGGVSGYGSAAVNTAALAARTGALGAMSSTVGAVAGPLAGALSIYNFAKNWQSGATGADALRGAQTGATVGSIAGPMGTLVGAGVGAAVGAASSLFGPGRMDPENIGWDQYAQAYKQHGAAGVSGATPAQNFQMLSGIFDARGSNIPFYQRYGRMGENAFMQDMTGRINQAMASGQVAPNSSPSQIYSQVVEPWINSMSWNGWQNTSTIQGAPEKAAIGNLLTNMIGQYQQGQISSSSHLGIKGQSIVGLQPYGAMGYNQQAYASTQQQVSQMMAPLLNFPMPFRQARM